MCGCLWCAGVVGDGLRWPSTPVGLDSPMQFTCYLSYNGQLGPRSDLQRQSPGHSRELPRPVHFKGGVSGREFHGCGKLRPPRAYAHSACARRPPQAGNDGRFTGFIMHSVRPIGIWEVPTSVPVRVRCRREVSLGIRGGQGSGVAVAVGARELVLFGSGDDVSR